MVFCINGIAIDDFIWIGLQGLLLSPWLNISTTPLRQLDFLHCLPFSLTTLRGKHCRHPISIMWLVDTFKPSIMLLPIVENLIQFVLIWIAFNCIKIITRNTFIFWTSAVINELRTQCIYHRSLGCGVGSGPRGTLQILIPLIRQVTKVKPL